MQESVKSLGRKKEDFLETILSLSKDGSVVKSVDIAKARMVSKATVSVAMRELCDLGLVSYKSYGRVSLTQKGARVASATLGKHTLLVEFLTQHLGVPFDEADESACKIEHAIGADIARKLADYLHEHRHLFGSATGGGKCECGEVCRCGAKKRGKPVARISVASEVLFSEKGEMAG